MAEDEGATPAAAGETDASKDSSTQHALAERLRLSREVVGLSQQHVAAHTGIPRSAISDIERGVRRVDSLELKKLAVVYGQSIDYLLGDSGDSEDASLRLLTRAHAGMTDHDRESLVRFAQFLTQSSARDQRQDKGSGQ